MKLFHGSRHGFPRGPISHFGSFTAAAHRLDSVFAECRKTVFDGEKVIVCDEMMRVLGHETIQDSLKAFAAFMQNAKIYEAEVDIKNPLRVNDCWTNDPIGSAAMELFHDTGLPSAYHDELKKVFAPFDSIVGVFSVASRLNAADIKEMHRTILQSRPFTEELQKRKAKLGPARYAVDKPYEIVWTYLTMRLKEWAARKGYDGFVYKNNLEGHDGNDAWATFSAGQVRINQALFFDDIAFLKENAAGFDQRAMAEWVISKIEKRNLVTGLFWGTADIARYWAPEAPGKRLKPHTAGIARTV